MMGAVQLAAQDQRAEGLGDAKVVALVGVGERPFVVRRVVHEGDEEGAAQQGAGEPGPPGPIEPEAQEEQGQGGEGVEPDPAQAVLRQELALGAVSHACGLGIALVEEAADDRPEQAARQEAQRPAQRLHGVEAEEQARVVDQRRHRPRASASGRKIRAARPPGHSARDARGDRSGARRRARRRGSRGGGRALRSPAARAGACRGSPRAAWPSAGSSSGRGGGRPAGGGAGSCFRGEAASRSRSVRLAAMSMTARRRLSAAGTAAFPDGEACMTVPPMGGRRVRQPSSGRCEA